MQRLVLGIGDETSFRDVAIFDIDAVGGGARDKHVFQHFVAALHFRRSASRSRTDLTDELGASFR